jgi:hypothetical protein
MDEKEYVAIITELNRRIDQAKAMRESDDKKNQAYHLGEYDALLSFRNQVMEAF